MKDSKPQNSLISPIDYVLDQVLQKNFLDEFTVYNAKDELRRLRFELSKFKEAMNSSDGQRLA